MFRRKLIMAALVVAITAVCCTGCGDKSLGDISLDAGESGLYINGTTVSYGMKETFDKSYYDKEELESVVNDEVDKFNAGEYASADDAMSVNTYKIKSKEAYLVFDFKTYSDYMNYVINYNQTSEDEIFLGSIADAGKIFSIDASFVNSSDGTAVSSSDILDNQEYNILIINESVKVDIEGGAIYMSDNCELDDDVITTADNETSYIIFK